MQQVCTVSNGWRSERLRLLGNKITVQRCLEGMEDILTLLLAHDKLPVVEADAIIKEQFDGRYDDLVAMLVCRPFDLFVDFHHAVDQCLLINLLTAYLWVIVVMEGYRLQKVQRAMAPLVSYGRMGLTNYIAQSVIGVFIFSGFGLDWSHLGVLVCLAYTGAQIVFSHY